MAKKVSKVVKLQVVAGKANPAPPVGPALGQAGVNIMGFCKKEPKIRLVSSFRLKSRFSKIDPSRSSRRLRRLLYF